MKTGITIIGYALVVILAVLLFRQCENNDRLSENADIQNQEIRTLELKNGQLASEKQSYVVTEGELRSQLWVKDDSLNVLLDIYKDPQVVYRVKTVTEIDTVKIKFEVPVENDFERTFLKEDQHYTIEGMVNQNGLTIDRMSIPNTQRIVTGVKKGWFKNDITTTVTNSNPFIRTEEMDTQTISVRNKKLGVGVFAGVDIKGNPIYGAGVSWHLFEF